MTPATFKSIRERCGYGQTDLARFLRITDRQVRMIEAGDRKANGPITLIMELLDAGKL